MRQLVVFGFQGGSAPQRRILRQLVVFGFQDECEFLFGLENPVYGESAIIVLHFLWVDVDERENILDGPSFAVLVFGDEVGDFTA